MNTSSILTVLFTDIVGSTEDFDRLGEVAAFESHSGHIAEMGALVERHGGSVVKSMGDGLMTVFSSAVEALRCAVAMQEAVAAAPGGLKIRVGIDCGEPIHQDGDYFGNPVIVAKRLCDLADPDQILMSAVVHAVAGRRVPDLVVADAGSFVVKGLAEPVDCLELRWVAGATNASAAHISVLIVDDQRLLRMGFAVILNAERGIDVVGEASDGVEAIEAVERLAPDVVVMDVRMPNMDGLEATRVILRDWPATRVLMLTTFDVDEHVYDAIRAGASGFLLKDVPAEQLVDAVRCIARGDSIIDPAVTQRMIMHFAKPAEVPATSELDSLTPREVDILRLLAKGLSNAEIASELFVEETTVKTHVGKVLQKLGLRDRVQAVVFAYESGFLNNSSAED